MTQWVGPGWRGHFFKQLQAAHGNLFWRYEREGVEVLIGKPHRINLQDVAETSLFRAMQHITTDKEHSGHGVKPGQSKHFQSKEEEEYYENLTARWWFGRTGFHI